MIEEQKNISALEIENSIFTVRGVQVMLDNHLAIIYGVETKVLNQAVKRNLERFPENYRFQLTDEELTFLIPHFTSFKETYRSRSQIVTLNDNPKTDKSERGQNIKYRPYVFTEQGVAMLSAVLRSETAIKVSVQIINAFVELRKIALNNAGLFQRLDKVEQKLLETDSKFERIFLALENGVSKPDKGIFYDGQVFDAYQFIAELVRKANKSIVIIDNYIDDTVLTLFAKRNNDVTLTLYTKSVSKQLALDIEKFNVQYQPLTVKELNKAHDRFIIIDDTELYHIGASLKDLGKKWFAFSKMDTEVLHLLDKLKNSKL